MNKSEKIRQAIAEGKTPKEIATSLKVPVNRVYTLRWQMKKAKPVAKRRIVITRAEADLAKKLKVPIVTYAKEKLKMQSTPLADFVRTELENIEEQISRLQNIAAFLSVRYEQLRQNGE